MRVDIVMYSSLFKDTHFEINNAINIYLIRQNIILYYSRLLDIYECLICHQHQYYNNQLKIHRHIQIFQQPFLHYQLKDLLKHYLNIMDLV